MRGRESVRLVHREKFFWFVLILSIFFWLLTVVLTEIGHSEPTPFWYSYELYFTFWPGLVLSFFTVVLSVKHGLVKKTASIFLPMMYIFTLPTIIHEMVPVFDVYHVIPMADYVVEHGSIDFVVTQFPLSHIYYGTSLMVFDIGSLTYARLFPTIMVSIVVLVIFSISRKLSSRWAVIAPLVFVSLNWYMEYHMCRQAFGVLIWSSFFLLLFLCLEYRRWELGVLAGVLLVSILPSHPGTIIIVSFNLIALAVLFGVNTARKRDWKYYWPVVPLAAVFFVFLFAAYKTIPEINTYFSTLYEGVLSGGFQGFSTGGPTETSTEYALTNNIRRAMGAFQSLLGLSAVLLYYKTESKRTFFIGTWFISCYFWLGYSFTHNGFLIERSFLTALIPASILSVLVFDYLSKEQIRLKRLKPVLKPALLVLVVIFLLAMPIAKNSIDAMETPSRQAFKAGRFSQENLENRVFVMDTHQGLFRYLESTSNSTVRFRARYGSPPYSTDGMTFGYRLPGTDNENLPVIMFTDYFNNYILIRYGNETAVDNIHDYEERVSQVQNKIYVSGGSRIYSRNS